MRIYPPSPVPQSSFSFHQWGEGIGAKDSRTLAKGPRVLLSVLPSFRYGRAASAGLNRQDPATVGEHQLTAVATLRIRKASFTTTSDPVLNHRKAPR